MYNKVKTPPIVSYVSFMKYNGVFFLVCAFDLCVLEHLKSLLFKHNSEREISLSKDLHTIRKTLVT